MNTNKKMLALLNNDKKNSIEKLDELKTLLEENIREEAIKGSKTKKSELSIIKGIFKSDFIKVRQEYKNKTWFTNKDFYTYLDGHRIFFTRNDLGYELLDENGDVKPFNTQTYFDEFKNVINTDNENVVSFNVDMVELKSFIDTQKKTDRKPFVFEINFNNKKALLGVNPSYLWDALKFANTTKISFDFKVSRNCIISPIFTYEATDLLQKLSMTLPVNIVAYGRNVNQIVNL